MKKLGYLRVSTQEQCPDRQIDGLRGICDELFIEHASAATLKRPVFDEVLKTLVSQDTLVVWDLDRAFRSVVDSVQVLEDLTRRDINLRIVNLNIDTDTPGGRLVFTILSACAEFERRINSQRTKEGMAAAKKRGKHIGRPSKLTPDQLRGAAIRIQSGISIKQTAADLGVAPWSLSRAMKRGQNKITGGR